MSLKVAVQMDPLEGINIEGDTTFLMMQSAQERGHSLWVYTPERMALESGKLTAKGIKDRLKAIKSDPEAADERTALQAQLALIEQEAAAAKKVKDATRALDAQVRARYATLETETPILSSNLCTAWGLVGALKGAPEPIRDWLAPQAAWRHRLLSLLPTALERLGLAAAQA